MSEKGRTRRWYAGHFAEPTDAPADTALKWGVGSLGNGKVTLIIGEREIVMEWREATDLAADLLEWAAQAARTRRIG